MVVHIKVKELLEERLYKGLIKAYKEKRIINGKRIPVTSQLGKQIIQNCKGICIIDEAEFIKDTHGFEIHHIDGDRTNNDPKNLVLLCGKCHKSITGSVDLRFRVYRHKNPIKLTNPSKSTTSQKGSLDKFSLEQEKRLRQWDISMKEALKMMGMHSD